MRKLIATASVDGESVHIYPDGFIDGVRAVIVYFAGPEGWGITMNLALSELESFVNNPERIRTFIRLAKDRLGLEAC
ncbi:MULTISPECIES: hypothetical protein [Vibrio]|uniref:hypothetical protein n=1 Tax=Vibrio chagasii TaxID=170679 RepID=UPI00354E1623